MKILQANPIISVSRGTAQRSLKLAVTSIVAVTSLLGNGASDVWGATQQEVAGYVRDTILGRDYGDVALWMTEEPGDKTLVARDMHPDVPDIVFPYGATWLVMIDDDPDANWGHPCRWLFVNDDLSENTAPIVRDFPPRVFSSLGEGPEVAFRCAGVTDVPCTPLAGDVPARAAPGGQPAAAEKPWLHAVLISGGAWPSANYDRYRQNLQSMYGILRDCGYPAANIFVYYADGSAIPGVPVTDSANESAIRARIQALSSSRGYTTDSLFVYVSNHGDDNRGACLWDLDVSGQLEDYEIYSPGELGGDTANSPLYRLFMLHDQCFSGEFIPIATDGRHDRSAIYVAAGPEECSYGREYMAQWEQNDPETMTMNAMHQDVVLNGNLTSTPDYAEGRVGNGDVSLCYCLGGVIPTVSEWGLVVLTLLLLTGAKVYYRRRRETISP